MTCGTQDGPLQEISEGLASNRGRWLFPKLRRASNDALADAKEVPEEIVKTWRNQIILKARALEHVRQARHHRHADRHRQDRERETNR